VSAPLSLVAAVVFTWLGMVLAISFLETPLKFRAPAVTLQIGLGIGRLVFRALNVVELVLAAALVVTLSLSAPASPVVLGVAVVVAALLVQVALVRPVLGQRSDRVLAGENPPRSRAHYWYVALELVKLVTLPTVGFMAMNR
jgi:hypothetical protein